MKHIEWFHFCNHFFSSMYELKRVFLLLYRLYPSSTELSVNLGLLFMKIEDYNQAFNQLGNAIAHDPLNADALFTFAAEIQVNTKYKRVFFFYLY